MASLLQKFRWSTVLYGMLTLIFLLLAASLVVAYFIPQLPPRIEKIISRSPYPVAIIGYREVITFRELTANMDSVRRFYENQDFSQVGLRVDFTTEDGQKRLKVREKEVLNKMIEDEAIVLLAKKRGIFVSSESARQGVARKLEEYGNSREVTDSLKRLYGWTLSDFEQKIVLPSLYEEKLYESFTKEVDVATEAKKRIEQAASALRDGQSFDDVVIQYSDGQTKEKGGDLGWFALEDLAPELQSAVASQKVGVPGSVIESSLGFHIIFVKELREEKGGRLYRISQVFARKNTFGDWLSQEMRGLSIIPLDPLYRFDRDMARVEFRDETWRNYEEELIKKSPGDASFFF